MTGTVDMKRPLEIQAYTSYIGYPEFYCSKEVAKSVQFQGA